MDKNNNLQFINSNPMPSKDAIGDSKELIYRRHPVNLAGSVAITVIMIIMIIFFTVFLLTSNIIELDLYLPYVILYSGVLIFFAISYFFMNWVFWYLDVWIIAKGKLIDSQLVTFFVRRRAELDLKQIQDIRFTIPGTLATIFSCGNVLIQSAAKESNFKLMFISNPRQVVQDIKDALVETQTISEKPVIVINPSISTMRLGEELIQSRLISPANLDTALTEQIQSGKRLGEILLEKGLLDKKDLVTALSSQYRLPEVNLRRYNFDLEVINYLTSDIAIKNLAIPISKTFDGVLIAIANPASNQTVENIRAYIKVPVNFAVADETDIKWAIDKYYNLNKIPEPGQDQNPDFNPDSNQYNNIKQNY